MRATLVVAMFVSFCLGGCGGDMKAMPSAGPPMAAPESAAPTSPLHAEPVDSFKGGLSLEDAARELERAERVTLALGARAGGAEGPKPKTPKGTVDKKNEDGNGERGGGCQDACSALGSMHNAASRLCELAGGSDARCAQAKDRVKAADDRVRASCPDCSAAPK